MKHHLNDPLTQQWGDDQRSKSDMASRLAERVEHETDARRKEIKSLPRLLERAFDEQQERHDVGRLRRALDGLDGGRAA